MPTPRIVPAASTAAATSSSADCPACESLRRSLDEQQREWKKETARLERRIRELEEELSVRDRVVAELEEELTDRDGGKAGGRNENDAGGDAAGGRDDDAPPPPRESESSPRPLAECEMRRASANGKGTEAATECAHWESPPSAEVSPNSSPRPPSERKRRAVQESGKGAGAAPAATRVNGNGQGAGAASARQGSPRATVICGPSHALLADGTVPSAAVSQNSSMDAEERGKAAECAGRLKSEFGAALARAFDVRAKKRRHATKKKNLEVTYIHQESGKRLRSVRDVQRFLESLGVTIMPSTSDGAGKSSKATAKKRRLNDETVRESEPDTGRNKCAEPAAPVANAAGQAAAGTPDLAAPSDAANQQARTRQWFEHLEQVKRATAGGQRLRPNDKLLRWCRAQFSECNKSAAESKLSPYMRSALDAAGIPQMVRELNAEEEMQKELEWKENIEKLRQFKERTGHFNPTASSATKALVKFVRSARNAHLRPERGEARILTDERRAQLDAIGFEWDGNAYHREQAELRWEGRLQELITFNSQYGGIELDRKLNSSLASWISGQRKEYRLFKQGNKSRLTEEKIARLDPHISWEAPQCVNPADGLLLSAQDWSQRSTALTDSASGVSPKKPQSKLDLSSEALAFTAPGGEIDAVVRGSKLEGGVSIQILQEFLEGARQVESPTVEQLRSFLPQWCWLKHDQIRHLFRNFCDTKEISGEQKFERVNVTRREVDIINFYIAEDMGFRDCFLLMPYRDVVSVSKLYKFLKKKRYTKTIPGYKEHISDTVGSILHLENTEKDDMGEAEGKDGEFVSPAEGFLEQQKKRQEAWDEQYQKLKQIKDSTGSVNVQQSMSDPGLQAWVKTQLDEHRKLVAGKYSRLSEEQKAALDALGFDFEVTTLGTREEKKCGGPNWKL